MVYNDNINEFDFQNLAKIDYTVRTDKGTELAGSSKIRETVKKHVYTMETTAPQSSSQNGMAERPHQTLQTKVRCLLYSARLDTTFWADALMHAVWLYNRTYHSGIKTTPYEAWTTRVPHLHKTRIFGSKVTVKESKDRRTSLDPNTYKGIFLGYQDTMDNIIYWDVQT